jgi:hypothetical protein
LLSRLKGPLHQRVTFPRRNTPFRRHGVDYQLSEASKSDIYRDALPLFNAGRARLLDLERLVNQLCSLERRTARDGRDLIDHPQHSGAHDDLDNAVCGAFVMLERDRRPQLISVADVVRVDGLPPPLPRSQYVFAAVCASGPTLLWCTALRRARRKTFSSPTSRPLSITAVFSPTSQRG